MSRYIKAIMAGAILTGLFASAGCVSLTEYQEALDANRHLREQQGILQGEIELLKSDQSGLQNNIDERQERIRILNEKIGIYETSIENLTKTRDELQQRIVDMAKGNTPPQIGDILPPQLNAALQAFAAANPGMVDFQQGRGMVKFKSDLTFDLGKDQVKAEARAALIKFAEILNDPTAQGFHIYIAGHTDNVPIKSTSPTAKKHPDNWYLSVHRAVAVQEILIKKANVSAKRIGVMGFGENHPIAPNEPYISGAGKGGNVKNRRVELWIVPPGRFLTSDAVKADDGGSK